MSKVFNAFTAGDYGDVIYMLATLKHVAEKTGPCMIHYANRGECKNIEERAPAIVSLVESQPYVAGFKKWDGVTPIHWTSNQFRYTTYRKTKSLVHSHFDHYRTIAGLPHIEPDFRQPWITVPSGKKTDTIVINRSPRYHNQFFQWRKIVERFGKRLVFVGLPAEHAAFCNEFGDVKYQPTETLLDAAKLIASSSLFIGNQSSCFAVAEGLKHPRILEVCTTKPDVIVAANQPHCQYSCDGSVRIEDYHLPSNTFNANDICTFITPPNGWRYPHPERPDDRLCHIRGTNFNQVRALVASAYHVDAEMAKRYVCEFTFKDNPGFFQVPGGEVHEIMFNEALRNAA